MTDRKAKKLVAEVLRRAYGAGVSAREIDVVENLGGAVSFLFNGRGFVYEAWADRLIGSSRMGAVAVALS